MLHSGPCPPRVQRADSCGSARRVHFVGLRRSGAQLCLSPWRPGGPGQDGYPGLLQPFPNPRGWWLGQVFIKSSPALLSPIHGPSLWVTLPWDSAFLSPVSPGEGGCVSCRGVDTGVKGHGSALASAPQTSRIPSHFKKPSSLWLLSLGNIHLVFPETICHKLHVL